MNIQITHFFHLYVYSKLSLKSAYQTSVAYKKYNIIYQLSFDSLLTRNKGENKLGQTNFISKFVDFKKL